MSRNASISNKVKSAIGKVGLGLMTAQSAIMCATLPVNAMQLDTVTVNTNQQNPFDGIGKIIALILQVMQYVGLALLLYGVYEIVMGMTAEGQAEKKTKGVIMAAAGIIMASMRVVLRATGLI